MIGVKFGIQRQTGLVASHELEYQAGSAVFGVPTTALANDFHRQLIRHTSIAFLVLTFVTHQSAVDTLAIFPVLAQGATGIWCLTLAVHPLLTGGTRLCCPVTLRRGRVSLASEASTFAALTPAQKKTKKQPADPQGIFHHHPRFVFGKRASLQEGFQPVASVKSSFIYTNNV